MTGLLAGLAEIDITPAGPMPLVGYPEVPRLSTGVHDPLTVTALVLRRGEVAMILVSVDLLLLTLPHARAIRAQVAAATGIAEAAVCIACTHTHSGPGVGNYLACRDDPAAPPIDAAYRGRVEEAIVAACRQADGRLRPAMTAWFQADGAGIGGNRQRADGPCDPVIHGLAVGDAASGALLAAVLVHAMHPTVLHEDSTLVSADYPGLARARLRQLAGPGLKVLHLLGAAGDQSPRRYVRGQTFPEAERMGGAVAERVAAALRGSLAWDRAPALAALADEVGLTRRRFPEPAAAEARLRRLVEAHRALRTQGAAPAEVRSAECAVFGGRELLALARYQLDGTLDRELGAYAQAPVQVLRIGQGALAAVPGEWFVEHGLALRRAAPLPVALVTLANGDLQGYLVTRAAEGGDSYEAGLAVFDAASAERMRGRLGELLRSV